ncbi:molybdopterin-synthase adenylyltransferase MoeB [Spirosoma aureum]|uniref:Molybdopterin-synthase adenylyltransferase n=1 Tax=Spirosoma aureum TaxID=2692134 RepID=A0A6G9AQI9_9BACT|nr:molybdopterin-synthase adenylyltransferase MoeB [Spirosoma aureum]QIP14606.1 molybdopterin-synthase adenylyltransferase MoeB [Spirosoma aureum]
MTDQELNRYNRHIRLPEIGLAGQNNLRQARVAVIGAGGLGCPVGQYLTAAGVGTLGLIDGDIVEESNLQRQVLFSPEHIGQPKAEVAAALLARQNPYIQVMAHPVFLDAANALSILEAYDIIVDGSDNFATRYLVNDACVLLNKPLIFGSIYKFEGQVSVFNHQGGPTYRCLYPEPSELEACTDVGVLGVLPGIMGCLMANEVIKLITGIGDMLSGKLLIVNALNLSFETFSFTANPLNKAIRTLPESAPFCADSIPELSVAALMDWLERVDKPLLLDVREPHEYERKNLGGILFPLSTLLQHPECVPTDRPVVIHCQSGGRSRKAVAFLQQKGFQNVYNLTGGLNSFSQLILSRPTESQ